MITIIQLALILILAYLVKSAKKTNLGKGYVLVLAGGLITFLSVPLLYQAEGSVNVGVQLVAEIFGIFCIIWSIIRIVKSKKKGTVEPIVN